MEKLSNIANESETAKNVFEIFAARERFRRETNLSRLQRYMHEAGKKVVEDELLGLFKKLETAGIGTLVVGRGNRNTRFKWHYNLKDVAKAAMSNKKLNSKSKLDKNPAPEVLAKPKLPLSEALPIQQIVLTQEQFETLMSKIAEAHK